MESADRPSVGADFYRGAKPIPPASRSCGRKANVTDREARHMHVSFRPGRTSALVLLLALAVAGGALAASTTATVNAASSTALGVPIVVDAHGFTLYHFTQEKKLSASCTGACRKIWPPLLVGAGAKPVAGTGLNAAKLGTIKRPDGGVQVTYGGFALYRYSGDKKAGQVNGQGIESAWYAITPAGTITRATASTDSSSSSSSSSTTTPASSSSSSSTDNGAAYNY
jgi:predicted lipoprotein with Yx(FWY)xxD motif